MGVGVCACVLTPVCVRLLCVSIMVRVREVKGALCA